MRPTYHLAPAAVWEASPRDGPYRPPSLDDEGFVHCTDGAAEMVATANRHYREDPRAFVVVSLDLDRIGSPWRIEDAAGIYPHISGPIDRAAVIGVVPAPRDRRGAFLPFADRPG
jgi:uncharacterized protein (DUF952 family)